MNQFYATSIRPHGYERALLFCLACGYLVTAFASNLKDDDVDLPKLPFPLPKRTSGFVYDGGHSSAPVHLSAYLDLTCADSKRVWPVIKKLAKSYGPDKLHLTVHFFALAYFNNAFRTLKSVYTVASYNSSLVFPWVDAVFENQDYLKNSARTSQMNQEEIAQVIAQMGERAGIPSSVMRDGLTNHKLESEARLAWKYACSKAVMGTPTFFLNDVFIASDASANWSEKQWCGIINNILPVHRIS